MNKNALRFMVLSLTFVLFTTAVFVGCNPSTSSSNVGMESDKTFDLCSGGVSVRVRETYYDSDELGDQRQYSSGITLNFKVLKPGKYKIEFIKPIYGFLKDKEKIVKEINIENLNEVSEDIFIKNGYDYYGRVSYIDCSTKKKNGWEVERFRIYWNGVKKYPKR
jgi:hypothetical protein